MEKSHFSNNFLLPSFPLPTTTGSTQIQTFTPSRGWQMINISILRLKCCVHRPISHCTFTNDVRIWTDDREMFISISFCNRESCLFPPLSKVRHTIMTIKCVFISSYCCFCRFDTLRWIRYFKASPLYIHERVVIYRSASASTRFCRFVYVYAELFLNIIEYGISSVCCCLFGVSSCIVILKTREEEKHQHHENVCLSFFATHKKALKWTRNMSKDEQMGGKAYYTSNFLKVSHFGFHHQFFFLHMEMRRSLSRRNDGCCLHKTRIHKLWRKTFERGKLTLNKKRGKMRRDWGEIAE